MGVLKVMGQAGDTRLSWDPEDKDQVSKAKSRFDDLVKVKRWLAWKLDSSGKKGEPIKEFDASAGAIIVAAPMQGG